MKTVFKHTTGIGEFAIAQHPITKRYTCWFIGGLISPSAGYKSKSEAKRYLVEEMRSALRQQHSHLSIRLTTVELDLQIISRIRL